MEKAPIAWAETGLFSGDEDLAEPSSSKIERTEVRQGGSSVVYVMLNRSAKHEKPWHWEVAVSVVSEDGHLAVDDLVFLKGEEVHTEYRLSEILGQGCDGPRWVGFRNQANQ